MRPARLLPFFRWFLIGVILAGLGWAGYYVYEKGFGRRWRGLLAHEFKRFGLVINVRRLTLDPFRGLTAQDVDIFQDEARDNLLAQVSNLSLDINYAALLQHEPALNAVDLRNAQLSIPLWPNRASPLRLQAKNMQARIYFVPGRIEIRQLSGTILGIRCTASGTLINPANFTGFSTQGRPQTARNDQFLSGIIAEIQRLRSNQGSPQLNFTFQGDMADLASLRIQDGSLQARQIDRLGYRLEDVSAEFKIEGQRLEVRRLQARDFKGGEALASGSWDFVSGNKTFEVRSSLDLATFLGRDPRCPWARDWAFPRAPHVEMTGEVRLDGHVRYLGTVTCDQFAYRGVTFQSLRANFSKDSSSWMVTDAEVGHRTGTLVGEGLRRPSEFRVRLQSGVAPQALAPLLPPAVQQQLPEWEFQASPVLQVNLQGPDPSLKHLTGSGQIWLGRTTFRGAPLNSASARFRLRNAVVDCDDVRISRDDGECFGAFRYDLEAHALEVKSFESKISPAVLAVWLRPELRRYLEGFRFKQNPTVTAESAESAQANGQDGGWRVRLFAQEPFTYRLVGQELQFDSAQASIHERPGQPIDVHFDGQLGSGTWVTDLEIGPDAELQRSTVQLSDVPLGNGGSRAKPHSGPVGRLSGSINGRAGTDGVMQFQVKLAVRDAPLERTIPLRPLLPHLQALGFGEVADVILEAQGDPSSLQVSRLQCMSGAHQLDLSGSIQILGAVLDLVGNCDNRIDVRVTGSLADPDWKTTRPGQPASP